MGALPGRNAVNMEIRTLSEASSEENPDCAGQERVVITGVHPHSDDMQDIPECIPHHKQDYQGNHAILEKPDCINALLIRTGPLINGTDGLRIVQI